MKFIYMNQKYKASDIEPESNPHMLITEHRLTPDELLVFIAVLQLTIDSVLIQLSVDADRIRKSIN